MVFAYNAKSICGSNMAWIPHWTDCKHSANFQGRGHMHKEQANPTGYIVLAKSIIAGWKLDCPGDSKTLDASGFSKGGVPIKESLS